MDCSFGTQLVSTNFYFSKEWIAHLARNWSWYAVRVCLLVALCSKCCIAGCFVVVLVWFFGANEGFKDYRLSFGVDLPLFHELVDVQEAKSLSFWAPPWVPSLESKPRQALNSTCRSSVATAAARLLASTSRVTVSSALF